MIQERFASVTVIYLAIRRLLALIGVYLSTALDTMHP